MFRDPTKDYFTLINQRKLRIENKKKRKSERLGDVKTFFVETHILTEIHKLLLLIIYMCVYIHIYVPTYITHKLRCINKRVHDS